MTNICNFQVISLLKYFLIHSTNFMEIFSWLISLFICSKSECFVWGRLVPGALCSGSVETPRRQLFYSIIIQRSIFIFDIILILWIQVKLVQSRHDHVIKILGFQSAKLHIPVQTNPVIEHNVHQTWTGLAWISGIRAGAKRRDILAEFEIHNVLIMIHYKCFAIPGTKNNFVFSIS